MLEPAISKTSKSSFKIKVKSRKDYLGFGLGIKDIIKDKGFNFDMSKVNKRNMGLFIYTYYGYI